MVATYNSTLNGTLDGLHFSLTFQRCVNDPSLSGAPLPHRILRASLRARPGTSCSGELARPALNGALYGLHRSLTARLCMDDPSLPRTPCFSLTAPCLLNVK